METFSIEIQMRSSHEVDFVIHPENYRVIGTAISDRVIPKIQEVMGTVYSGPRDIASGRSVDSEDTSG